MKGDPKVNNALDETVKRESSWIRKYSPTCDAQSTLDLAMSSIGLQNNTNQNSSLPHDFQDTVITSSNGSNNKLTLRKLLKDIHVQAKVKAYI